MIHFYCGSAFFHIAIQSEILENKILPILNPQPSSGLGKEAEPSHVSNRTTLMDYRLSVAALMTLTSLSKLPGQTMKSFNFRCSDQRRFIDIIIHYRALTHIYRFNKCILVVYLRLAHI